MRRGRFPVCIGASAYVNDCIHRSSTDANKLILRSPIYPTAAQCSCAEAASLHLCETVNMSTNILKTDDGNAAQAEPDKAAATAATNPARFINKKQMLARVGASYPSIWQWMREGKFPRSRELGGKAAWLESEIEAWIVNRPIRRLKAIND